MHPINITATTIPDAWFQCIDAVVQYGRKYTIDAGSYQEQMRWELDYVSIIIVDPGAQPLIPEFPPHLKHIPPPCDMDYVNEYLAYLLYNLPLRKNEQYTYGQRIDNQMSSVIDTYLSKGYHNNQMCISVAKPDDIDLDDPPCLRSIDTKIVDNSLHFYLYFRSWDLWEGFPANLAALYMMLEYMALCIGVQPGMIIASSKGLHLYDFVWNFAELLVK